MVTPTSRLKRYRQYIDNKFIGKLLKNQEYTLEGLLASVKTKIEAAGNPWYSSKTIKQELGAKADAYFG